MFPAHSNAEGGSEVHSTLMPANATTSRHFPVPILSWPPKASGVWISGSPPGFHQALLDVGLGEDGVDRGVESANDVLRHLARRAVRW